MYRWTTPTNLIETDLDLTEATVYLTYSQAGIVVIEKTNDSLTITPNSVSVQLTQQETASLNPHYGRRVQIQIRYVFSDGTAGASNIMETTVEDVLKDGEIGYEAG